MSWGVQRVSPATNCAAVTGEGNQLNPRAEGQATRQARQTRLNECETINNFGEKAVVNKMPALKVKAISAVGKSEGGKAETETRGMHRHRSPTALGQAPSTNSPRLSKQPGLSPCLGSTAGACTRWLSPPPRDRHSPQPAHSPPNTPPYAPSQPHLRALVPQLHQLTKHHLCFLFLPPQTASGPGATAPMPVQRKLFQQAVFPLPSLLPRPPESRQRRGPSSEGNE